MVTGVHIRLTLTRGVKATSGMDPRLNQSGPTLIVLAEHKAPVYDPGGLTLIDRNDNSTGKMAGLVLSSLLANSFGRQEIDGTDVATHEPDLALLSLPALAGVDPRVLRR